ncbi:MAG: response regulator [Planctomycetaceae bacterium]|nr:response regulator [Planctomycetaceae bacterium]MCP4462364.1 response regulator [Planctomycetaceae bacterium]MDG1808898.1 response regulator [Pirellulaceae bacterium]
MATTRAKKILCVTDDTFQQDGLPLDLPEWCEVVKVNIKELDDALLSEEFDGYFILNQQSGPQWQFWHLLQNSMIFNRMPDGFAVTDRTNQIVWANKSLGDWFPEQPLVGLDFFDAMGRPEIIGECSNPLASALKTGCSNSSSLKCDTRTYYRLRVAPVSVDGLEPSHNLIIVSDASEEVLHVQKLEAIHNAGSELADLTPEEVCRMNIEERIDLLKANILYYTQDLLGYDVVEIRLIDRKTNRCETLLSEGIDSKESKLPLFAEAQGNGVTGFVCATGKSYLCEDTTSDRLYVDGLIGAKSSLTVPLMLHDQVIGSFNVESPQVGAFTEADLQLLQIFSKDIARALNSLELLVTEKTSSAKASLEAIETAVGLPIDEILNDTVHVIENYIGQDANVSRRLRRILKNSREIKQVIHNAREEMTFGESVPESMQAHQRPLLRNARVLVVDCEDEVRNSAHLLLEPFGCIVETAHEGNEALMMVRNSDPGEEYDAIIADIRLPDLSGYNILMKLKESMEEPPLVLMTGFGYDPGHSIVKARQAGLKPYAILYKPFKLEQLLETIERLIQPDKAEKV